jgi:hypothetical protein
MFCAGNRWRYMVHFRAMPQLRQLLASFSLQWHRFNPRSVHVGFMMVKVAYAKFSPSTSVSSANSQSTKCSISLIKHLALTIGHWRHKYEGTPPPPLPSQQSLVVVVVIISFTLLPYSYTQMKSWEQPPNLLKRVVKWKHSTTLAVNGSSILQSQWNKHVLTCQHTMVI